VVKIKISPLANKTPLHLSKKTRQQT